MTSIILSIRYKKYVDGTSHSVCVTDVIISKEANEHRTPKFYTELDTDIFPKHYSQFLIENQNRWDEIANDFQDIFNLRNWLWFYSKTNDGWTSEKHEQAIQYVKEFIKNITFKYDNLYMIEW